MLSVQGRDYIEQYRAIHVTRAGERGLRARNRDQWRRVASVWFWYFDNDLRALDIGLGLHEGDWEGVQQRMAGKDPDLAVYAQHG